MSYRTLTRNLPVRVRDILIGEPDLEEKAMRHWFIVLIVGPALALGSLGGLPAVSAVSSNQIAADFAKKAVPRALDYDQGNRASLVDAQDDFTEEGWREFMNWMGGYVDDKGSPTGSSLFTATGEAVVKSQENGIVRLTIPGTLKQQSKNAYGGLSAATYRVTVDVELGGSPLKIRHLKTTTCGAKPCKQ